MEFNGFYRCDRRRWDVDPAIIRLLVSGVATCKLKPDLQTAPWPRDKPTDDGLIFTN